MATTKKALKSIKSQLEAKNHEAALYEASELRKRLSKDDPEAAQVLVFQGLALLSLDRIEEAEKSYLIAYRLDPQNPLPSIGLRRLYEKKEQWDKLAKLLEVLVQTAYDQGDAEKCASALQDLVQLRAKHGPEEDFYRALRLLLPSSPLIPILQPLPPPQGAYVPFPSPVYPPPSLAALPQLPRPLPHVIHLLASLPLLLNLLIRQQVLVHTSVEAKVKAGRTRLGAGTEKDVRRNVEAEVLGGHLGMELVDLLREVSSHPAVEDIVRREVEVREFEFWTALVGSLSAEEEVKDGKTKGKSKPQPQNATGDSSELPPTPLFSPPAQPRPTKAEALTRADGLAKGFVLLELGGPAESGWSWVMEGMDEPTIFYDHDLLLKFAKAFPDSSLTDFIDDYCRWFHLPLPEPEGEAAEDAEPIDGEGEAKPKAPAPKKGRGGKRGRAGLNARERRKARRLAEKDGVLSEDLDQEERDELVASMTKLLDKLSKSIFAQRVMARISIQEEDWANAVAFAEKGRTLVKDVEAQRGTSLPSVRASSDTALGVALVPYFSPKHHPRATRLLNGVLGADPANSEARFARAQIFQTAGNWSEARKHFQQILDQGGEEKDVVAAREEVGWCLVNEGKLEEGRDILETVVEMRDARQEKEGKDDEAFPRARAWWRLGRTEWMIGDDESRQHAEDWFMASIRALPTFAPSYTSLGICYSSASPPDEDRALKCFQKAFELDATEADAARRLAIGYADDDEWALVRAIATRVMEGEGGVEGVAGGEVMNAKGRFAPKNGWAWKALGSTEMFYRNYAKAAQALQIALRAEPDDVSTWLLLGESYVKCGRHIAGLKALQKALELDPGNWMAWYDIGEIHVQLATYDKAVEAYEKVQEMTGRKELGVTAARAVATLALGQQSAAGGFRERSRRAFHSAIGLAAEVLRQGEGHRPWGWKLIGDAAFELANHEPELVDAEQSAAVLHPVLEMLVVDDADRRSTVEGLGHAGNLLQASVDVTFSLKSSVFAYAYRAYLCRNDRTSDSALYDFATALHTLASRTVEDKEKKSLMKGAISAIRVALEKDAGDERLWNALGVICGQAGSQLAQHAFVVSLELYAKDPVTWANLGFLYLELDDSELANQCFLKAQIIDPDYARAWLGQGLLAERNDEPDHARALFAHAVTLSAGSLLEADLAMAASVFERFLRPGLVDPNSLHQPAFALKHYCHQRPRDSVAAHLHALICERLGLTDDASAALERAAALLEEEYERTESSDLEIRYSIALCNLGRIRLGAKQYDRALEAFSNCWELIEGSQDATATSLRTQVRLGQALSRYWIGETEASLEAFQVALNEAEGSGKPGLKEEVAVLLARTLWGLGGEDAREAAKTHLMECLSGEHPPIKVIATLGAIALVESDQDLLDAALTELNALPLERRLAEDPSGQVELILSSHSLASGDQEEALSILQGAIISNPSAVAARNRLAKLLLSEGKSEDALSALMGPGDGETMRLRGAARMLNGDEAGMGELQKAVQLAPWEVKGWEALAWGKRIMEEADNEGATIEQVEE